LDASRLLQNQSGIELDSTFEEEVERALQSHGFVVHRQIGASGYKIDLAIVNPKNDQEYILGIECDGAAYHSSYSARMNDRMRQDVLGRLGWNIYRIWSQHWIYHKEKIINDISHKVSEQI
jgi:very-short-patch-repair endonuclease